MKKQSALLQTIVILFWFSIYIYIPYQAPYLSLIGAASGMIGVIVGAYGFFQIVCRIPMGIIADRYVCHKRFILGGSALCAVASLIRVFFPDGTGYLIASAVSGIAVSTWISFMTLYTNMYDKKAAPAALGRILAASYIGMFAAFVTGMLFYDSIGMGSICLLSVGGAVLAFLCSLFVKEPHVELPRVPISEHFRIMKQPRLIFFSIIALVQLGMITSTANSFTSTVAKSLGANGFFIGLASMCFIVAAILSTYFGNTRLAAKGGAKLWIPVTTAGVSVYCLVVPSISSLALLYPLQILVGAGQGLLLSYLTNEAISEIPQDKHCTALGFFQAVYAIGMTFFPMIFGAVAGTFSMAAAFYTVAAICALSLVAELIFYAKKH